MKIAVFAILGLIALTGVLAISTESYGRSFAATRTVPATKTAGDLDTAFRFAQINAQGHIFGAPATKVVMNGGKNVKNKAGSPDAAGQDAANGVDLRSIVRECPKRQCGANSTCPNPGGTCCGTDDNYCCPMGSTCLTTKPPTCIQDAPDDPFRCAEDDCMPGYHCPHANVTKCCLGGTSCCAAGLQCRATNPPTCVPEDKRAEETKAKEEHDSKKSESAKEEKKELKFLGYDKKHHGGKAAGGNLAKAATAFTNSNEVGGHPISKINDGTYGDSSSFYCSIDSNAFLGVSWSSDQTIRTVCFSRDNTGARKDRASGEYTLQYASVAGSAETPEAQWKTVASMKLKAHRNSPEKRHCFRFSADFVARALRLKSSRAAFACDEFEAYGTDLAEWWN